MTEKEQWLAENLPALEKYKEFLYQHLLTIDEARWALPIANWTKGDIQDFISLIEKDKASYNLALHIASYKTYDRILKKNCENTIPIIANLDSLVIFLYRKQLTWQEFREVTMFLPFNNSTETVDKLNEELPKTKEVIADKPLPVFVAKDKTILSQFIGVVSKNKRIAGAISMLLAVFLGVKLLLSVFFLPQGKLQRTDEAHLQTSMPYPVVLKTKLENIDFNKNKVYLLYKVIDTVYKAINLLEQEHTISYYNPGIHKVYLCINGKKVDSLLIKLSTNQWYCLTRTNDTLSIAPNTEEEDKVFKQDDTLHYQHPLAADYYKWTAYNNVGNFQDIAIDGMTLTADLLNNETTKGLPSYDRRIVLFGEHEKLLDLNFTDKNHTEYVYVKFGDMKLKGTNKTLQVMNNIDKRAWQKLKIIFANRHLSIYSNDMLVYQTAYSQYLGKLYGIGFSFRGNGKVSNLKIVDNKGLEAFSL